MARETRSVILPCDIVSLLVGCPECGEDNTIPTGAIIGKDLHCPHCNRPAFQQTFDIVNRFNLALNGLPAAARIEVRGHPQPGGAGAIARPGAA